MSGIAARSIVAWRAPSPSSPAPAARRFAASGLDRSVRPSKPTARAADAPSLDVREPKSTFTEISYTKLLTFPQDSRMTGSHGPVRHPVFVAPPGTVTPWEWIRTIDRTGNNRLLYH
jgi:hypothetical protein